MKILQVIPSLDIGGAERLCSDISNALTEKGHEVHIVIFSGKESAFELNKNIKLHYIPFSFRFYKSNYEFEKLVFKIKPEIIHSHLHLSDLMALSLKRFYPIIIHFHGPRKEFGNMGRKVISSKKSQLIAYLERRFLIRKFRNKNVGIISISEGITEYIKKYVDYNPTRFHNLKTQ